MRWIDATDGHLERCGSVFVGVDGVAGRAAVSGVGCSAVAMNAELGRGSDQRAATTSLRVVVHGRPQRSTVARRRVRQHRRIPASPPPPTTTSAVISAGCWGVHQSPCFTHLQLQMHMSRWLVSAVVTTTIRRAFDGSSTPYQNSSRSR